jgi:hypothetical protein
MYMAHTRNIQLAAISDLLRVLEGTSGYTRMWDTEDAYAEIVRRGYRYNPTTDHYEKEND